MKLSVQRADPAGNITLFVLTPVEEGQQAAIGEKLMKTERFHAEQVGFCLPAPQGCDGALRMSGGEFCGNATRSYGMLLARERGLAAPCHLTLRVSGCDSPVGVDVDLQHGTARSEMPLPRFVRRVRAAGEEGTLVHLGGIAHFIVRDVEPTIAFFEKVEQEVFSPLQSLDAYGVMFSESETGRMTPLVKVPAVGSFFWEGSCGSGSVAAALADSEGKADGEYSCDMLQPAGVVRATVIRKNGRAVKAYIGGKVTLDAPLEIEI